MVIGELALWEKTGGRSGVYRRGDGATDSALDGAAGIVEGLGDGSAT
jgi:hypothetical protein